VSVHIRAVEADLPDSPHGIQLPDAEELRARGVLAAPAAAVPVPRRILKAARLAADEDLPGLPA
jgi:hypothetical protein